MHIRFKIPNAHFDRIENRLRHLAAPYLLLSRDAIPSTAPMVAEEVRDLMTDILARELNNQYQTRAYKSQVSRIARSLVCGKKQSGIDRVEFAARDLMLFSSEAQRQSEPDLKTNFLRHGNPQELDSAF